MSRRPDPEHALEFDGDLCLLCGSCELRCVYGALVWRRTAEGSARLVSRDVRCRGCGDCVAGCPSNALGWKKWARAS